MGAAKGNSYWKLAKGFGVGTEKKYTPEELWNEAIEYASWAERNPLREEKVFATGVRMKVKKMRALTIKGFCLFANISCDTFENYSKDEAYFGITNSIKNLFYTQKLEGAAADLLNANLIAREIGLADKQDINANVSTKPMSKAEAKKYLEELDDAQE